MGGVDSCTTWRHRRDDHGISPAALGDRPQSERLHLKNNAPHSSHNIVTIAWLGSDCFSAGQRISNIPSHVAFSTCARLMHGPLLSRAAVAGRENQRRLVVGNTALDIDALPTDAYDGTVGYAPILARTTIARHV